MLEKDIERKFKVQLEADGRFRVVKFVSPGNTGVPDRMVLGPRGFVAFVEFKLPGKTPTPKQAWWLDLLRSMGHVAFWSDNAASAAVTVSMAYDEHTLRTEHHERISR